MSFFRGLLIGTLSYIPGFVSQVLLKTGGTHDPRYCYSVWMRHLVKLQDNGLPTEVPAMAELGPGDSLGIGLTALLTGVERYHAFDVYEFADLNKNLKVLDELVALLRNREAIPDAREFPKVDPRLKSYDFPHHILTDERLERYLHPDRLETIRQSIRNPKGPQSVIQYQAPWTDFKAMREESVDLILSQAVLEHIDDLEKAYQAMQAWLKPGGVMSHCIDFKCHNTADQWNGHWTYSDFIWNWMRGKRPYLLNREPLSTHLQLHRRCGFTQVELEKTQLPSHLKREDLMPQFQNFEADDLVTSTVFIQSRKERRSEN